MDTNYNRVYINPNFNKATVTNPIYLHNYYHINPNFTQNVSNMQLSTNVNRKIYVNPNFIKPNSESKLEMNDNLQYNTVRSAFNNEHINNINCTNDKINPPVNIPTCNSTKSRYRLVRNNDSKPSEAEPRVQGTCTIKISKYKSIPIHNYKSNLQINKQESATKQTYAKCSTYKFIKQDITPTINKVVKLSPRPNPLKVKRNVDLELQTKLKVANGSRKKNNIPCRLFTKYGKCLRNIYGTCKYVHDRKHVSLCRKFIKGICHDKDCLLSHELSSKKMPTCFFYLKGMCTKEDCPYLHVKLSENSKICPDFLKGYCVKGDMCSYRHVKPQSSKHSVHKTVINNSFSNHKINKTKANNCNKSIKINQYKRLNTQAQRKRVEIKNARSCKDEPNKEDNDCRYFKDDLHNEDIMCEVLKPTRCKLGTLPSFIQL